MSSTSISLRAEIETFLFEEAALLDAWELDRWLALLAEDFRYEVPATDAPEGDPATTLHLVADNLERTRSRVKQLLGDHCYVEQPRSRCRHLVTNVRIAETDDTSGEVVVCSNFVVYRFQPRKEDSFVGCYRHVLSRRRESWAIRSKRATLDHFSLYRQGVLSILL